MPKKRSAINLLPQEEFAASITGRLLRWAMTTFRYIVIVTEMIVMGAFLSRFWLDARNSDLNDELDVKVAQIKAQSEFENDFRNVQERLRIFSELADDAKSSDVVSKVTATVPPDVSLQSVSFQGKSLQIKGVSGSELGVAQFVSNLKAEKSFKGVSLEQVNSSEDDQSSMIFNIKISL